jgi:hypothetical protein
MSDNTEEYEMKKKAIFDSMAKRGQERILRIGYENWNPFEEPKDPRERIFGSASQKANALLKEFYEFGSNREESVSLHKELFELCRGLIQEESRAQVIYEFCKWYAMKQSSDQTP